MKRTRSRGFTLVEVLVALMIVALGLTALMVAVSGTARSSGHLRDKTLAQWIALNRLSEVRLLTVKVGQNSDAAELLFAGRKWHYDTRYFDTSISGMRRVVVRVYAGDAKSKGNAIVEATGFTGSSQLLMAAGSSNVDWTQGSTVGTLNAGGVTGTGTNTGITTNSSSGTNSSTGTSTNTATSTNSSTSTSSGSSSTTSSGTSQ